MLGYNKIPSSLQERMGKYFFLLSDILNFKISVSANQFFLNYFNKACFLNWLLFFPILANILILRNMSIPTIFCY